MQELRTAPQGYDGCTGESRLARAMIGNCIVADRHVTQAHGGITDRAAENAITANQTAAADLLYGRA